MPDERDDSPDDKLMHEAEELMRQKRFRDAARRYQDLHGKQPTDLWTSLGFASALECAGEVETAERVLEDAATRHGLSASLHRFRHLFFVRREDLKRATASQQALRRDALEAGESDQLADLYFNQGRYHEALAELERRLAEGDRDERAGLMARSGACLRQTGDAEAARDRLLMALALDPDAAWTLAELAEAERAIGLADQARVHYRQALAISPEDHWTRGHLAQLESEQGDKKAAIALYEEILVGDPEAAWAKVELAQVLADSDGERAGELCRSALADDPEYPWAHAQLGQLARKAGRFEDALNSYQRGHMAAPEANWILHEATEVARQMGKDDIAERLLERARAADPYDATTHGYIADLRRHQGRLRDAAAHLEQAVAIDTDYTWAWRELAEVRAMLGEHDAAEAACKQARDLAPDDAVSDGLVAFLLKHRGLRDRGLPWLERAVERQQDYLWAWRELIELHLAAGRAAEAEQAARAALIKLPGNAPLLGLLAECLRRRGELVAAENAVGQAISLASDVPQLWALRAEIALMHEDAAAAVTAAARAAALDRAPEFATLHAQALLASGNERAATVELNRALGAKQPPAAAFELSAALAERQGDRPTALAQIDLAIARGDDPRLRIRRARLAVQGGDRSAAEALLPLVEQPTASLPWAELALTLANAGHVTAARRAASRFAVEATPASAFQHLAEVEWNLGFIELASAHIAAAIAAAPHDPGIRTLAAVIAESSGEPAAAAAHLDAALAARPDDQHLMRQIALLRERTGQQDAAEAMWRRLADGSQPGEGRHLELCAALWRLDRHDEATRLSEPHLAAPASVDLARLWRDRGLHLARRNGPVIGLAAMAARGELLGNPGRALAVQLALGGNDVRAARMHLDAMAPDNDVERRARDVLSARTLLAEGRADQALVVARAAAERWPGDEDPLIAAADALLALGRTAAALDQLDGDPVLWPPERAAVAACIALAVHGPGAAAARLVRSNRPGEHPLGRLMAAALPDVASEAAGRAAVADVATLPPVLVAPLAQALGRAGRHDLAGALRLNAAGVALRRGDDRLAIQHRRAARQHLRARAGALAALSDALTARDLPSLLRHLFP